MSWVRSVNTALRSTKETGTRCDGFERSSVSCVASAASRGAGAEQADIAVGQLRERVVVLLQEVRRRALGDQQREHLAKRQRLRVERLGRKRRAQDAIDVAEVAAIPGGEAVAETVDFAHTRLG